PATPAAPTEAGKPVAGTREESVSATPQAAPVAKPMPPLPIPPQSASQSRHGNPAEPTPVFHPPLRSPMSPLPAQPAPPHSGVRHYQGPPVPYGGVVVFDNLPKARLKFTF